MSFNNLLAPTEQRIPCTGNFLPLSENTILYHLNPFPASGIAKNRERWYVIIMKETTKTAVLFSLGCRLNTADSALLVDRLERAGYRVADIHDPAVVPDLVVINSCTVTGEAARKSRQTARQLRRRWPGARLVATGCSAELDREEWLRDGVADAVLTNPAKRRIEEFTGPQEPAPPEFSMTQSRELFREKAWGRFPYRSRAFVKIQEGCGNFCSYCIVPYARGPERSRDFEEVVADCRQALAAGMPELVLTGVNTAAYRDGERDLGDLVGALSRLPGEFRIRLSSTEPHPSNLRLLEIWRDNPKICRFLHLSLQHGADRILTRMNRHYTVAEYARFVAAARAAVPDISLGTDVIVGFPGETDADFEASRAVIRELDFANTHLFRYSPRPGTPAASFPDRVPVDVVKKRYAALQQDADDARKRFIRGRIGTVVPVIFEEVRSDGFVWGWTDHYIQVRRPAGEFPLDRIVALELREEDAPGL